MLNTTKLKQIEGGRQVKQADNASLFSFLLLDANGREINLDGKEAQVVLYTKERNLYWQTSTTVKGSVVEFLMPGNLTDGEYVLEISSAGYVFPSDELLIIKVNKGFAEYVGMFEAYAIKASTKQIIEAEARNATANIAKQIDYSKLKGDKGDAFKYEDFTEEQLKELKGEKGDAFTFDDFTSEQLEKLRGEKGDAFTYDDFTSEQLEKLKGAKGDSIELRETRKDEEGNTIITFSDGSQITIPKGEKGDALKLEDLSEEDKKELLNSGLDLSEYAKAKDLNKKVDKEVGKGLSENNYTNKDKEKVDNIPENPKYTDTKYLAGNGLELKGSAFSIDDTIARKSDIPNIDTELGKLDLSNYVTNDSMTRKLDDKVDKEEGKELSSNNYTDEDKQKLQSIPSNAKYTDTTYQAGEGLKLEGGEFAVDDTIAKKKDIPKYKEPDLTEYAKKTDLNEKVDKVTGKQLSTNDYTNTDKIKVNNIPTSNAKYTDTTYKAGTGLQLSGTTFSVDSTIAKKSDIPNKIELTSQQKEELRGKQGVPGKDAVPLTIRSQSTNSRGDKIVVFSDGNTIVIPKGDPGEPVTAGIGLDKYGSTISVDTSYVATKSDLTSYAKASDVPKLVILSETEYNRLPTKDSNTYYFIKE